MIGPKSGDYVLLIDEKGKNWLIKVVENEVFHTHRGRIKHDDIIKAGYGSVVYSDKGHKFHVVKPTIYEYIMKSPRPTQIVYPKDIGYIILRLGIKPESKILEVGMGSGAITSAILQLIDGNGFVDSYEKREDITWSTIKYLYKSTDTPNHLNIHRIDFKDAVIPKNYYDSAIIDIDEPWNIVDKVYMGLRPSGRIAIVLPTYNQLDKLEPYIKSKFIDIEAIEISIRKLQFNRGRIRPEFRMIGFTAILVTAIKTMTK